MAIRVLRLRCINLYELLNELKIEQSMYDILDYTDYIRGSMNDNPIDSIITLHEFISFVKDHIPDIEERLDQLNIDPNIYIVI